jgi:hypothetical protein
MSRSVEVGASGEATAIQAAHDGRNLHLKFSVEDAGDAAATATSSGEHWPRGEHVELWLFAGRDRYVFALNRDGEAYDAKNLDRAWDSGWQVKVRKIEGGWEAIAVMPLSTFGFESGKETHLRWFATRETSGGEELSYQGKPLFYRNFPIVIQ